MPEHDQSSTQRVESTVHRVERGDEPFSVNGRTELARLLEESWRSHAEATARTADLARRAYGPIQGLLEQDEAAKAAVVELQRHRRDLLERMIRPSGVARTFEGPDLPILIPALHAGVNVFASPFDFQLTAPTSGEVTASADRLNGTFSVLLGWGHGGARFATAGVGLTLRAGATGVAHIRPAWRYEYQAIAEGFWLGSHTEGAGKVVVQDAITGAVLKEQTSPLWNFNNDHWEDQNGYIPSWSLGLDVFVQGGQVFTVSFLATAMVDDSGTGFFWSLARAFMEMRVAFVVVELGP